MYGRLGVINLLHLTEAEAQRRLAQARPVTGDTAAGMSLAMALRLIGVLSVGFCAIAALAVMVG
ncbi:hypothetical protein [Aliirhizobium cellulosilyticum]|uniref:Uncharacterized protein n=1 Tax=Aliirhizobium cellulosilyticum TaxID=393664 RepID=A0A7W6WN31_9HYPH|nr:hypothetical protein [Rhizobium cellulosilyticum]MBB4346415.1 hypothetical protein [Rhizobium cellulosilyticum]MBB4411191.1 hypothetical protein [Rhizobium cellulosilyticum]MBB4445880.1 hypothetical protein [Rhizobium cellulosilyticum]